MRPGRGRNAYEMKGRLARDRMGEGIGGGRSLDPLRGSGRRDAGPSGPRACFHLPSQSAGTSCKRRLGLTSFEGFQDDFVAHLDLEEKVLALLDVRFTQLRGHEQ